VFSAGLLLEIYFSHCAACSCDNFLMSVTLVTGNNGAANNASTGMENASTNLSKCAMANSSFVDK